MEGVEILNQFEVPIEHCLNWTVFWITFSIFFIGGLSEGIILWLKYGCVFSIVPILTLLGLAGGFVIGLMFGNAAEIPTKYETHYQVIITDEVKMTEFNERYEILDQEGKIYTVREK